MTIDPTLLSALRVSRFWTDVFGETSPRDIDGHPEYSRAAREPLTISVGKRKLQLSHDDSMTWWGLELGGVALGRDGGDEQYPPYPDALRGIEVEQIARAAAIKDNLVHPGPVVALLARFAPICEDDHGERWRATIAAAFRWLGADRPRMRYRFWDHRLLPAFDSTFRWRHSDRGMIIEATDRDPPTLASLRVDGFARTIGAFDPDELAELYPELDGASFPHAELHALLAAADKTCDGAVTDRSPRTRDLARLVGAGDLDAAPVLADHLADHAHPAIISALRRRETWAAEIAAGVSTWSL